jgi:acetyl esterase/lipase
MNPSAWIWLTLALVFALAPPSWADEAPAKLAEVEATKDLPYYTGDDADKVRHTLDVYRPKGQKDVPVLIFVHGGAWVFGDKDFFGVHSAVGKAFARHGICTVVTNYRLSPGVKHPEHVKDVARAFAWTVKNIGKYGGKADQIFVCGHSAGGHLVSLLATDNTYLKAEGLSTDAIKGVIPLSGVYAIPDGFFKEVFGGEAAARKDAGPISHVREGLPPFLIIYGDRDYPFCDVASKDFCKALKDKKVDAEALEIKKRDHFSIVGKMKDDDDATDDAILRFIQKTIEK